ncbi:hypothetical protein [Streptomyces sp. NRRL F-5126]|uniref:RsiG family protein n=1 Tax=Streptomyces sp. NRRL F-5126 TaxID=1463857 RepID=UPI002D21AB7A|nr:hypothetical protein [Streptomyces sp. NRRL F-5126]
MSTSGAGRAGQAWQAGRAEPAGRDERAGQGERDGRPAGAAPAAPTTACTGRAAGGHGQPGPAGAPGTDAAGTGASAGTSLSASAPVVPAQRPHDFTRLGLDELRALRRDSQHDEADLSYLRRLLQGRIDILRDELGRRTVPDAGPAAASSTPAPGVHEREPAATARHRNAAMVERLAEILSDTPSRHRQSARHVTLSTPRGAECRELAAQTLAEVELSDLAARTDDELHAAMRRLVRNEQQISRRRHQLQRTVDGCSAEIARRYREGEAQVDDLLT